MPDANSNVSQLISDLAVKNDEQRWETVVQLFGPGIRAWLQMGKVRDRLQEGQDINELVQELFAQVKPALIRQLHCSPEEFSARLTGAINEFLGPNPGPGQSVDEETQSFQLPSEQTRSFAPETNGIALERLMALLPQLAESTRVVAAMRWIEGLKYREISERIGLPTAEVVRLDREAQAQLLSLLHTEKGSSGGNREPVESSDATIEWESREKG